VESAFGASLESAFGASLESGCRFFVRAFERNFTSVVVKLFSRLVFFTRFYKGYTSNAVCNDNAAINSVTLHTKNVHSQQLLRFILLYIMVLIVKSSIL
jgi:hypothetical protein